MSVELSGGFPVKKVCMVSTDCEWFFCPDGLQCVIALIITSSSLSYMS